MALKEKIFSLYFSIILSTTAFSQFTSYIDVQFKRCKWKPLTTNTTLVDNKKFLSGNKIKVTKKAVYTGSIDLKIYYTEDITRAYRELSSTQSYPSMEDGNKVLISKKGIKQSNGKKYLQNNYYVKFEAVCDDGAKWEGEYQIRKRLMLFTKVKSPILFSPKGNLSEFELNRITPSLGGTILQYNTSTINNSFISMDGLITLSSREEVNIDGSKKTLYSVSLGGVIDFNGIIQAGINFDFKENRGFLIIGVRPEIIAQLLGA